MWLMWSETEVFFTSVYSNLLSMTLLFLMWTMFTSILYDLQVKVQDMLPCNAPCLCVDKPVKCVFQMPADFSYLPYLTVIRQVLKLLVNGTI